MTSTHWRLLFSIALLAGLLTAVVARADDGYCCLCTGCEAPIATVCEAVMLPGLLPSCLASCPGGCSAGQVLEGACELHAAECTPPAPAPAASRPALVGLAALLAGGGFYLARKRGRA